MGRPKHADEVRGWIAPSVQFILQLLTLPSTLILTSPKVSKTMSEADHLARSVRRAKKVDAFILGCLFLDAVSLWWIAAGTGGGLRAFAIAFVAWRIIDVLATSMRVSLFDEFDMHAERYVHSAPTRVVVLGLVNYFELIICFAGLYAISPGLVRNGNPTDWFIHEPTERALHLSFVTQLTVGYGDFYPNSWLRPLSWLQSLAGLGIIVLVVARFMAVVPQISNSPSGSSNNS